MKEFIIYILSLLIGSIYLFISVSPAWEVLDDKGSSTFLDLIEDHNGDIVAVGYSNYQSFGGYDMLFCKYDPRGKLLIRDNLGMNRKDVALDIELLPDGNYLVSGYRETKSYTEGILLKLDKEFKTIWYRNHKIDPQENQLRRSIATKTNIYSILQGKVYNHLIVSDNSGIKINDIELSTIKGDVNDVLMVDNSLVLVGSYLSKAFVARVDLTGEMLWQKKFGRSTESAFNTVLINSEGNIISIGYTETEDDQKNGYYFICDINGNKIGSGPKNYGGPGDDVVYTALLNYGGNLLTAGESLSYERNAQRKNIFFKYLDKDGTVSDKEADFYSKSSNQNDNVYASILSSSGDMIFAGSKKAFLRGSDAVIINYGKGDRPKEKPVGDLAIAISSDKKSISAYEQNSFTIDISNSKKELRSGIYLIIRCDNPELKMQKEITLSPTIFQREEAHIEIPFSADYISSNKRSIISVELIDKDLKRNLSETSFELELIKPKIAKIELAEVLPTANFYERSQSVIFNTSLTNSGDADSKEMKLLIEHVNQNKIIETIEIEPMSQGSSRELELRWESMVYDNDIQQEFQLKLYDTNSDLISEESVIYDVETEEEYLIRQADLFVGIQGGTSDDAAKKLDSLSIRETSLIADIVNIETKTKQLEIDRSNALETQMQEKEAALKKKALLEERARIDEEQRIIKEQERLEAERIERDKIERERAKAEAEAKSKAEAEAKRLEDEKQTAEAERRRLEEQRKKKEAAEARRKAEEKERLEAEKKAREEAETKRRAEEQERLRKAEEARLNAEEQARKAEVARIKAEEEQIRLAEEARKAKEEAQRIIGEEAKKRAEQEARIKAEALKRAEEEAKKKADEEAKKKADKEAKRRAEEEARKAEEEARQKAEEENRRIEEEGKSQAEAEAKKAEEEKAALEAELKREEERRKQLEEEKKALERKEKARQEALEKEKKIAEEEKLAEEEQIKKLKEEAENLRKQKEAEEKKLKDELALQQAQMEEELARQRAEMEAEIARQKAEMEAEIERIKAEKEKAEREFIHAVWTEKFIDRGDKPFISQEPIFRISLIAESDKPLEKNNFKVFVNERYNEGAKFDRVKIRKKKKNSKNTYTFSDEVSLEVGMNKIEVFVANGSGKTSTGTIRVQYEPSKPNLYLYSIGIPHEDLKFTTNDAGDFAKAFLAGSDKVFAEQFPVTLNTAESTEANNIKRTINKLAKDEEVNPQITSRDVMVIFVSSHGFTEANELFLKASDWDGYIPDETSVNFRKNILQRLSHIPCKKMIFIDACQSGGGLSAVTGEKDGDDNKWSSSMLDFFSERSGMKTLFSCGKEEYSYEDPKWQNGAFTEAIIKAIHTDKAQADSNNNKELTIKEIYAYIKKEVPSLINQKRDTATDQNPVFFEDSGVEYPVIIFD